MTVDTILYEVKGSTAREWRLSMREQAQKLNSTQFNAWTTWTVRFSYQPRLTPRGCEDKLPKFNVTVRYTMPHRSRDSLVAPALEDEWSRFERFLWRHEEGHATRAVRAADEMADSLRHLATRSCDTYGSTANRMWDAVSRKYQALQMAYDARTRHGATQGAVLPSVDRIGFPIDTTGTDTLP